MKWIPLLTIIILLAGCATPDPNRIQINQDYRMWQDSQVPSGWY
ncbi:MAG: hypothetical protein SNJ84_01585 [Verrucomicrobiia bacterium]